MQSVIMSAAVTAAIGSAVFNGLKKNHLARCDLCQGLGGAQCFVCSGSGKRKDVPLEEAQRGSMFKNVRECGTCGGSGLIRCRKCKGSGFLGGL